MDEKLKPILLNVEEKNEIKKDLSFNEGIIKSLNKILELYDTFKQKRNVYVRINGSDNNVGKSALLNVLQKKLLYLKIPTNHVDFGKKNPKMGSVIFTTSSGFEDIEGIDFGFGKFCDLYVGIYSKEKQFDPDYKKYLDKKMDIIICNEYAKNNPDKLGKDNN